MSDKPIVHGRDHRPGGYDPSYAGPWHYIVAAATAWNSGTTYTPGDVASHDVFNYVAIADNTNVEPNVAGTWQSFWQVDVPFFQNSWVNSGGSYAPMRFRLVVGPPIAGVDIDTTQTSLELQGSVTGGTVTTAIFTLPDGYRPNADLHLAACDDSGSFVVFTVQSGGDVLFGFV